MKHLLEVLKRSIRNIYNPMKMHMKYGYVRPKPREILFVDPRNIDYRIASKHLPNTAPAYGTIGGKWDLNKSHWAEESVFYGLIQRFDQGKPWEETIYYQKGIKRLENNKRVGRLDGPQTISNFNNYLNELDELYEDIKNNGYDKSSEIVVNIGRHGEWIVHHGNHRHTISRIIGVKEIPIRIKYRHKQWQKLRVEIHENGFSEHYNEDICKHPDIRSILHPSQ